MKFSDRGVDVEAHRPTAGGLLPMNAPPANHDTQDDWISTFVFWGTLLAAGALFAAVALAPKLQTLAALDAEYAAMQYRLVALERQACELTKVTDSLKDDPAFAAELAKLEFSATRPGDEAIGVPQELQLGASESLHDLKPAAEQHLAPSIFDPLLEALATQRLLRFALLAAAGLLAVLALLTLHESLATPVCTVIHQITAVARSASNRYRRSA